jgi:hydroxyquinol 1,2-dioxygenase
MRNLDEHTITEAVLDRHSDAPDLRLKEVMTSLVRRLHAFAREVQLTEAEWETGIRFLTEVGHLTDAKRQEFILLSDTLGLSMLVTAMANRKPAGCTEATVFGPFFVEGAPVHHNGDDVANGASGEPAPNAEIDPLSVRGIRHLLQMAFDGVRPTMQSFQEE